jgi:preprotein translocase subunit SecE
MNFVIVFGFISLITLSILGVIDYILRKHIEK